MSIAEKSVISTENAQAIFENQQRVFDKGYEKGTMPIYNMGRIDYAWQSAIFPENTELTLHLKKVAKENSYAFPYSSNLKYLKLIADNVDETQTYSFNYFARECEHLEVLDLTEYARNISSFNYFVYSCKNLKSILGALDISTCTLNSNPFTLCSSLEDIEFVPNTIKSSISFSNCQKLTNKSKQSIFEGLGTVETAKTLTLHSSLKILQSQVDSAYAKGWTIAGGTVVSEEEYYG